MYNPDTIVVRASAENFAGSAQFLLQIDGIPVGSPQYITANHQNGESQVFTFAANISNAKQVSIAFINDFFAPYGTGIGFDRNMYVDSITINGQLTDGSALMKFGRYGVDTNGKSIELYGNGSVFLNINGYAGADSINKLAFGVLEHSPLNFAGQVYAVYDALLGRAPDPLGLEGWTLSLNSGASLQGVVQTILGSPEGQARLGAQDDTTFVEQLYQSTLHRHSDPAGLAGWASQLNSGTSRADVALSFALSPEHITDLSNAYDTGFFVPGASSADVARLYYAVLDRAPDAAGLSGWTGQVDKGTAISSVTQAFLNSPEFNGKFGALTDTQYVDTLYMNALGRHADSAGLSSWVDQLSYGVSRATVATMIGQSVESQLHHLMDIEAGWHLL